MDTTTQKSDNPSWEAAELYKQKKYREALVLLGVLIESGVASDWDRIRTGWCLFHTKFKIATGDALVKIADEIIKIIPEDKAKSDLLVKIVTFKAVDALKQKTNVNHAKILDLLSLLNPKDLSAIAEPWTDRENKQKESASDLEKYYAEKTKALLDLAQWNECIIACENAIKTINKFHSDNDIWFRMRHARSLKEIGRVEDALTEMKEIATKKHEWYVESGLANIYNDMGDIDSAWRHGLEAALELNPKDAKFGVTLFELMGNLLMKKQKRELADKHFSLAIALRNENEWKIPDSLQRIALSSPKDATDDAGSILGKLRLYWRSERQAWVPIISGSVKSVFPNELGGFIIGDDGHDYYFRTRSFIQRLRVPATGTKVQFEAIKSFDKKKQRESLEAARIQIT